VRLIELGLRRLLGQCVHCATAKDRPHESWCPQRADPRPIELANLARRRLLGQCIYCGAEEDRLHDPSCIHCRASRYYGWHACHACAVELNIKLVYGEDSQVAREARSKA
jgi:hypothetical protein